VVPLPEPQRTQLELLVKIAKASAKLVDAYYEFDELDADSLEQCLIHPLEEVDDLLIEAGYRPEPPPPPDLDEDGEWFVEKRGRYPRA
jgi:hypothetical protein